MILPSIDLRRGRAVQLRSGKEQVLDAGPPEPWLQRFSRVGEVAVVDLDAALGEGDNRALIRTLCRQAPCRVGGGIRDLEAARATLDAGATKVVLGTKANPELLRALPQDRVVAALDAEDGEVVIDGWRRRTGQRVVERLRALRDTVSGFLVTCVEREGRMTGLDLDYVKALRAAAGDRELVFAGGVASPADVAALHDLGVDAQVGMALYTGAFSAAEGLIATLQEQPQGLWPTVVCDELGRALGLCWSSAKSLRVALEEGRGVYQSRRRGLWRKGETSGNTQELVRVEVDCDRDALRFVVRQRGAGFCHLGDEACWGAGRGLGALPARIRAAADAVEERSYTRRLLADPGFLRAKLLEEAGELAAARGRADVAHEAADLLYFAAVAMQRAGTSFADVDRELELRSRRITRRSGAAKAEAEL